MLGDLRRNNKYQNLAFPYKNEYGLAGGDWNHYLPMIDDFAFKYNKHVTLVKKTETRA